MFGKRWQLFRLLGIPISVDASWLIILALLTLSFTGRFPTILHDYFPGDNEEVSPYVYWIMGLVTALAFFTCILLHELGHAVIARSRGMPIRGITLFLFGGVAELGDEPPTAGTEFLMAIAGPVVSLVLAIAFWFMAVAGYSGGWPHAFVIVLGFLAVINGMVLVFNMIPAFPLDGGRVLRSILWGAIGSVRRATYWASLAGQAFAWFLIVLGVIRFFEGDWLGGIWSGMIGMFLNNAAQGSYQQVLVRQALQGEPLRRFMNTNPIIVPPTLSLLKWVDDYVYRFHRKFFPVGSDGRVEGFINTQTLTDIPRNEWDRRTVNDVMKRDLQDISISSDADALQALGKMQRTGSSRLLVMEDSKLVGILTLKDLLSFLDLKIELQTS